MSLRIAVTKPDWGIAGGFEGVVARVCDHLAAQGHEVHKMLVPVDWRPDAAFGIPITSELRDLSEEFARYAALFDRFEMLDVHRADLMLSTQPPSFATSARRHLSLFFHHARAFYDLANVSLQAGIMTPEVHSTCVPIVRDMDAPRLDHVGWFLAGSPTVRDRLARYNGIVANVSLFQAGVGQKSAVNSTSDDSGPVLCVSRHEFPKRTELFAHAMALQPRRAGISVGSGGRLGWVQQVHQRLLTHLDPASVDDRALWCCDAPWLPPDPPDGTSQLAFAGRVDEGELDRLYRGALCVVAPALDEDYGLTALEAMSYAKPVIVCRDGGGLADLVEHRVTGLVVEPTGAAIAAAVDELAGDQQLRRELGDNGRAVASRFTWERALAQVDEGIENVMTK